MYAIHKKTPKHILWQVARNLNQNIKAQLLAKYGLAEEFDISDSVDKEESCQDYSTQYWWMQPAKKSLSRGRE